MLGSGSPAFARLPQCLHHTRTTCWIPPSRPTAAPTRNMGRVPCVLRCCVDSLRAECNFLSEDRWEYCQWHWACMRAPNSECNGCTECTEPRQKPPKLLSMAGRRECVILLEERLGSGPVSRCGLASKAECYCTREPEATVLQYHRAGVSY